MAMTERKFRLLTRSDFDGLVTAILLKELDMVEDIEFVHPNDVQSGKVEVTDRDILTNLPYVEGCYLCFDHHESEKIRAGGRQIDNFVLDPSADSAARVVFEYYGGWEKFFDIDPQMLKAVDRADAARFTKEDILNPQGWEFLSFIMDSRTGLGRFRDFTVSNYQLLMDLIDHCKNHTIDEILALPDLKERVDLYNKYQNEFRQQVERCSSVHGNLVVLDLRNEEPIYPGNRFMIYVLFPKCNISIHVIMGRNNQNTAFAIGKSIFERTSKTNIGALALEYGGGGHVGAGGCQISNEDADRILEELVAKINADG